LDNKLEDKNLHLMIASIPRLQSALIFLLNRVLICYICSKYLKSSTLAKDLLSVFVLWLHPAVWSRDMTPYLVLSAFTSGPTTLLATIKVSAF
jgi:hypothetical protein